MLRDIERTIMAAPGTFFPGEEPPRALSSLLVKGSLGAHGGRVTFLVFRDGGTEPAVAAKIARDPAGEGQLSAEAAALKYLAGLPQGAGSAAPRLIYEGSCGPANFVAEEAVRGVNFGAELDELAASPGAAAEARLLEAAAWLSRLAAATARPAGGPAAVKAAEGFRERYRPAGAAAAFLDGLLPSLAALDRDCPRVFTHGDLSPMNLYFGPGGLRAIDWAESAAGGLPLHDLFFLLCSFPYFGGGRGSEGERRVTNFKAMFLEGGEGNALAIGAAKAAAAGLKLGEGAPRALLYAFLLEMAVREYDVLERQGRRGYIVAMEPFGGGASWADGTLPACGLYARLFSLLAGGARPAL